MNAFPHQIHRGRLLPGLTKRLLFVAILTVAANYFFWRHRIGINLPLYAGLLCFGMVANGRGIWSARSFWIFVLLLAGSILAGANATSLSNFLCLATILTLLAGVCFYRPSISATIFSSDPELLVDAVSMENRRHCCLPASTSRGTKKTRLVACATNPGCRLRDSYTAAFGGLLRDFGQSDTR